MAAALAHNNQPGTLTGMPAELRNMIYDALIDTWVRTHGPPQAHRWEIVPRHTPPGFVFTPHPTIMGTPRRLVMTPAERDPNLLVAYQNALQDLVGPSHSSQRFLRELRSRQRNQLVPFIHLDCLDEFMDLFYPLEDEITQQAITGYVGQPITLTFRWVHPQVYDVLPLINFLRDSPDMNLVTWAYEGRQHFPPARAMSHGRQIATSIFGTLRNYIDTPNANSFHRIMFRSHNPRHNHNHARLEIWFNQPTAAELQAGVDNLDWVDGKNWIWPRIEPLPNGMTIRKSPRNTSDDRRRRSIEAFLRAAGLFYLEIAKTWSVYLGIAGKHQKGGRGIAREKYI